MSKDFVGMRILNISDQRLCAHANIEYIGPHILLATTHNNANLIIGGYLLLNVAYFMVQ